ncbi:conserved hypothetical protein [Paraburkholderia piptadeniae]|uniref:Uncharacterized protein n=1 Tax=Paraburkholderia piptadeniae TaxID=1701573 RepID=A0A1N7S564_9BURK|nr:conserved hypothetical protein [Paraburkholderia piptadeniae]
MLVGTDITKAFSAIFILYFSIGYTSHSALRNEIFHPATAVLVPRSTIFYEAKKFFAS